MSDTMRYLAIGIVLGSLVAIVRWLYRQAAAAEDREIRAQDYRTRHPEAFPELPRSLEEWKRRRARDHR